METDKMVKAMARWWQTVKEDDHDAGARNPMLYDPLTENNVKTTKLMQYVATFVVCLGAISAGTALAWTSPVLPQMTAPNVTVNASATAQNTTLDGELYLTPDE
uniref:Uncharacterized protein n=1 Tax=Megaselia scalaris TaxID=36166 RepID=T1GU49_MEGSC